MKKFSFAIIAVLIIINLLSIDYDNLTDFGENRTEYLGLVAGLLLLISVGQETKE